MIFNEVSVLSIVGMFFALVVSVAIPIVLCIITMRKTKAKFTSFLLGCAGFVSFAIILEGILNSLVYLLAGTVIQDNAIFYVLYGSAAAGIFEETGRFVVMKFFMKNRLDRSNALMYGIGHGVVEAIIIVGTLSVSNIISSIMINFGQAEVMLSQLDPSLQEQVYNQFCALWTTPSINFFMGGFERITAIILHISLSIIVFKSVKKHKIGYYFLAIGLHFAADCIAMGASMCGLELVIVEVILLAFVLITGFIGLKLFKSEKQQINFKPLPQAE